MKLLLFAVHFLFASYSYASGDVVLTNESQCENGQEMAATTEMPSRQFSISDDRQLLTVSFSQDDGASEVRFSLTLFGKNTYMAIPESDESSLREFFVKIDPATEAAQIYFKDDGGALCGGGLVLTEIPAINALELETASKGG